MGFSAVCVRAVGAMRNFFNREYDAAALLGFAEGTPIIRTHLLKLYTTLFMVSLSSAVGSYMWCHRLSYVGRIFAVVAGELLSRLFCRTLPFQQKEVQRISLLSFGSLILWACVTPWLAPFLGVDGCFVVRIWVCGCVSFVFFKMAIEKPYTLALVCFQALAFCVIAYADSTGDSASKMIIFWIHLFFILYVVDFSQGVVLKVHGGDGDFVAHAVRLYILLHLILVNVVRLMTHKRRSVAN